MPSLRLSNIETENTFHTNNWSYYIRRVNTYHTICHTLCSRRGWTGYMKTICSVFIYVILMHCDQLFSVKCVLWFNIGRTQGRDIRAETRSIRLRTRRITYFILVWLGYCNTRNWLFFAFSIFLYIFFRSRCRKHLQSLPSGTLNNYEGYILELYNYIHNKLL